jgi:hypothetical protein
MAVRGPDAKGVKLGHTPNAEWIDVPDAPFDGPWPVDLPKMCGRRRWHELVVAWWAEVRVMPHCRLWTATDWRFALETAYMKQKLWLDYGEDELKSTAWTELRRREDQMGYTAEARRKLRIRYVHPDGGDTAATPMGGGAGDGDGTVVALDSRRSRVASA